MPARDCMWGTTGRPPSRSAVNSGSLRGNGSPGCNSLDDPFHALSNRMSLGDDETGPPAMG